MDGGFSSLRSEAAEAMRTALMSAENLQLTLKAELSQEEQALTHTRSSPKETQRDGYCRRSTLQIPPTLSVNLTYVLGAVIVSRSLTALKSL